MGDLSRRLDVDLTELDEMISGDEPGMGIVGKVAKELSLPKFAFFMAEVPDIAGALPDFRSDNPTIKKKSRQTVEAIQFAEGIQRAALAAKAQGARTLPRFTATSSTGIEAFALTARRFVGITADDQLSARDAKAFYTVCRKKIEDAGIYVLHASFPAKDGSGFCLYHHDHPIIVINTKQQTRGRRLFTLIHELAHVLMGESGISDPFVNKNSVEKRCNRFAAAFLMPKAWLKRLLANVPLVDDPDMDDVARYARRLKMSQEATVLRLEQLGMVASGSYARWIAIVKSRGDNPDFFERSGGNGQPPPQEKTKLAKYGFRFASTFSTLLESGNLNPITLYRSSGLKPAYQRAYFDYAKSLSNDQLRDLELDDE